MRAPLLLKTLTSLLIPTPPKDYIFRPQFAHPTTLARGLHTFKKLKALPFQETTDLRRQPIPVSLSNQHKLICIRSTYRLTYEETLRHLHTHCIAIYKNLNVPKLFAFFSYSVVIIIDLS